jgi:hypothetical protein
LLKLRYAARALRGPDPAADRRSLRRTSGAPRASNSGRNSLQIEYSTAVASIRKSIGLGCLLLVVGGWRGFVRIDSWLLAGWSWGRDVPFPELALEVGHVRLVGKLVQVRERRPGRGEVSMSSTES